jgi:hypothetical protein
MLSNEEESDQRAVDSDPCGEGCREWGELGGWKAIGRTKG